MAASAHHLFDRSLVALGAMLVVGALLAGSARRSYLSLAAVFVAGGLLLGHAGTGLVDISPRAGFVSALATVALVVILLRDGIEIDAGLLRSSWHLPLRKLVLAMPITAALVALAARALVGLGWTEAFLLGALLAPTDPVLSSNVVTDPRVPAQVRHSLNLESGLNDGLALPAVLALLAAADPARAQLDWLRFFAVNVGVGVGVGLAAAWLASRVVPRERSDRGLYALGVAFTAYGAAALIPDGNGLIAVFVAAIALGLLRPEVGTAFATRMAEVVELVKLGIFVVFGALLSLDALTGDGVAAVALVAFTFVVARPVAVFAALAGTRLDLATRAFMGWFGPKGVATIAFSLIVLGSHAPHARRLFDLAALAVVASIVVHGLTDHAGPRWLARHSVSAAPEPGTETDVGGDS